MNRQTGGGSTAFEIPPSISTSGCSYVGSGTGTAAMSAFVYGWSGLPRRSSVGPGSRP